MSWNQSKFDDYMTLVRAANWHYEWFKRSSLHNFTSMLKPKNFQSGEAYKRQIRTTWDDLPKATRDKYSASWDYVKGELFPGGPATGISQDAVRKAREIQARTTSREIKVDEEMTQRMFYSNGTDQNFRWSACFNIRIVRGVQQSQGMLVHVTVPIAGYSGNQVEHAAAMRSGLTGGVPDKHRGARLTDQVRLNWSSRILERWKGGTFVIKDEQGEDLQTFLIQFALDYVGNPSLTKNVVFAVETTDASAPPDGTVNTMYWGVNDGGVTGAAISHEFGHLLGNPDEYNRVWFNGYTVTNNGGIMHDETNGHPKAGHFYLIARHVQQALGAPAARCFVRFNNLEYAVSSNHPWL